MLAELERLASASGIKIIDVRPQTPGEIAKAVKELVVDIRVEGSIEGLVNFIYQVENSLALLRVKRLQIGAKPNTQELEGSFTLVQTLGLASGR